MRTLPSSFRPRAIATASIVAMLAAPASASARASSATASLTPALSAPAADAAPLDVGSSIVREAARARARSSSDGVLDPLPTVDPPGQAGPKVSRLDKALPPCNTFGDVVLLVVVNAACVRTGGCTAPLIPRPSNPPTCKLKTIKLW